MGSGGLVTGVEALAKHKVAGSTSVTRSQEVAQLDGWTAPRANQRIPPQFSAPSPEPQAFRADLVLT